MTSQRALIVGVALAALIAGGWYVAARRTEGASKDEGVPRFLIDFDDHGPDAEQRTLVHEQWNAFAHDAIPSDDQVRALLHILGDMEARYQQHQREVNQTMTKAMLTHDLEVVKARAAGLHLRDYDRSVEDELRQRVRVVLNDSQYQLFERNSLGDAATLTWGAYRRFH